MVKQVYKFGTGENIPEDAVYLGTIKQTKIRDERSNTWKDCWLVWHYFLVEVEE